MTIKKPLLTRHCCLRKVLFFMPWWHTERIFRQYLFKNEASHNIKFNEECYKAMINDFLVPALGGCCCERPSVLTRRRYMPYSQRNNQFIRANSWWTNYFASWSCGVASKIIIFCGLCEVVSLRRKARDDWHLGRNYSARYCCDKWSQVSWLEFYIRVFRGVLVIFMMATPPAYSRYVQETTKILVFGQIIFMIIYT